MFCGLQMCTAQARQITVPRESGEAVLRQRATNGGGPEAYRRRNTIGTRSSATTLASTLYSRPQCELRPDVAETLDRLAERIVERAAQNRADDGFALRVFDAGCGAGHLTKKIAALSTEKRKVEVIAVDISPRTIEYCNQNKPANVKYECGDVGDYPHPSRIGEGVTFDVVVFHACLQHVFSPLKVLQAASRLLRGGGAVIVAQAQGRNHADELRVKDPVLQPRGLPASPEDVEELIPEQCPLELASFKDEVPYVVELKVHEKIRGGYWIQGHDGGRGPARLVSAEEDGEGAQTGARS